MRVAIHLLLLATTSSALKVAVTGPTGKLGRAAVRQLVTNGHEARILLRHNVPTTSEARSDPAQMPPLDASSTAVAAYLVGLQGVEAVKGDINDEASLEQLLTGCSAVLSVHGARRTRKLSDLWTDPTLDPAHAKNVNYEGIKKLVAAMRKTNCKRIVRITGKGETPWSLFSILLNALGSMAKAWNNEGEHVLREAADIDYTIIRPGVMSTSDEDLCEPDKCLTANSLALADDGGDLKVTPIPHGAIANLCVEVLKFPNTARSTLTAMQSEAPGKGSDSWAPLLAEVKPDQRAFRTDLLKEHFLAVRVGGTVLALILAAIALGFATALKAVAVALIGAGRSLFGK
jgi:putative NADH-flavin reductase